MDNPIEQYLTEHAEAVAWLTSEGIPYVITLDDRGGHAHAAFGFFSPPDAQRFRDQFPDESINDRRSRIG
jgi:hypothetical protein